MESTLPSLEDLTLEKAPSLTLYPNNKYQLLVMSQEQQGILFRYRSNNKGKHIVIRISAELV